MIINRVFGKVEKHSAKEWFEANLGDSTKATYMWAVRTNSKKAFSQDFVLDTHNAGHLDYLFQDSNLTVPPIVDIASAQSLESMFKSPSIKKARFKNPSLNLKDIDTLFYTSPFYTSHLESFSPIYLKNVTNSYRAFYDASSFRKLPPLETNASGLSSDTFWRSYDAPGTQTLEIDTSPIRYPDGTTVKSWCLKWSLSFGKAHIDHDTALYLINNLIGSGQTLSFSSYTMALLSDEEKAIATGKGWSLSDNG